MMSSSPITLIQPVSLKDYPQVTDMAALAESCHFGRILQIHPQQALLCRQPVWIGHTEAEQRFFFGGKPASAFNFEYSFPPSYLSALPHARLIGDGFVVVTGDNRLISESYSGDHVLQHSGHFLKQTLKVDLEGKTHAIPFVLHRSRSELRFIDRDCFLPTNYWHFNYHHWLVECLPRLSRALEAPELADCPVIVPERMVPFQEESLRLLGISKQRFLHFDGGEWRFERLYVPSVGNFLPQELTWLQEQCRRSIRNEESDSPALIYVSRSDATTRRLINELEILAYLKAQGFQVVTLTGMPFREQVSLFAKARVVIGPHGSGLTNILFSSNQAFLIELMPADQANHCFWLMTNALGQRYSFVSGPVVSSQRDFSVSLERVMVVVEETLSNV